jgi:hypothetical protein
MVLKPDPVNKTLIKVFYHDSSAGVWFSEEERFYANSQYKLNLLGNITEKHKINGFYGFTLDYGSLQISWHQRKNIKDTTSSETSASLGAVVNNVQNFHGMARSDYGYYTLYDGMFTSGYWWFCLGALDNVYKDNTFPGAYYSDSNSMLVNKVTLWLHTYQESIVKTCKRRVNSYDILLCFVINLIASN